MMLSLEDKIGQMLVVGFHGLQPPDYILEWLSVGRISGVVLFGRNIASPQQVADLTQACHEAAKRPIFIVIDQEGGIVTRFRKGFSESPGAMALGVADSESLAEDVAHVLGKEMRSLGFNWNLAPVVDLTHDINNPSVGTRSLGTDKVRVGQLAAAQIRGFQKAGVAATAKHFPGIGNTPIDTHDSRAIIDSPPSYLWEQDLVPFRAAIEAGVNAIMVSHVMVKAIDDQNPSTLSPKVIQELLRRDLNFKGLVCTDCMEMHAISDHYMPSEAALRAVQAGQDLLFFSHSYHQDHSGHEAIYDDLVQAVNKGIIAEARIDDSVGRIQALKGRIAIHHRPSLEEIGNSEHQAVMSRAARDATVLLRSEGGMLPLNPNEHIAAVEFAPMSELGIIENGGLSEFCKSLVQRVPSAKTVSIVTMQPSPDALRRATQFANDADILILATRNAHLYEPQLEMARELLNTAKKTILICLRNPYDASVLPADVIICTCSDTRPSLAAVADVLVGTFTPSGKLPVPVEFAL
jgi:beta-N-acetylhexosaminidase